VTLVGRLVEADAVGARGGTNPARFVIGVELKTADQIRGLIIEAFEGVPGGSIYWAFILVNTFHSLTSSLLTPLSRHFVVPLPFLLTLLRRPTEDTRKWRRCSPKILDPRILLLTLFKPQEALSVVRLCLLYP
jgi:hypothetical protein